MHLCGPRAITQRIRLDKINGTHGIKPTPATPQRNAREAAANKAKPHDPKSAPSRPKINLQGGAPQR